MKILLDTHVFVWLVAKPGKLSKDCEDALADLDNQLYVSAATVCEIAVKHAKGRLHFSRSPVDVLERMGMVELAIRARHCEVAAELPGHHRDPFDRLLVAQAEVEGMTIATRDALIAAYQVGLLRA